MKRVSAIFFFILYLTSTTEASQLMKLPVILQHYHEHRQQDQKISFIAFLDMHYMHGSPHDDDYERDMQLPFKRADHHAVVSPVIITPPAEFTVVALPPPASTGFFISDDDHLYCKYHHAIFQPPRA